MTTSIQRIVIYISVPLVVGVWIYVLRWYHAPLPGWILYNLPDFLWLFSLSNLIGYIWQGNIRNYFLWTIPCFLVSVGSEYAQRYHIIPGTYDLWDIAAYCSAFAFSLLHILQTYIYNEETNRQ